MHALPTYLGRIMYLLTEWATGRGGGGGRTGEYLARDMDLGT